MKYAKGAKLPIADALSRVSPQPAPPVGEFPQLDIHQITKNLPALLIKLQQIRNKTGNDPMISKLCDVIYEGYLATREKCPKALHNYWNFREELIIEDGLISILARHHQKCHQPSPKLWHLPSTSKKTTTLPPMADA